MIVTRSLTKRYGSILAVDHVDLEVREGDRYGFLGPNGPPRCCRGSAR